MVSKLTSFESGQRRRLRWGGEVESAPLMGRRKVANASTGLHSWRSTKGPGGATSLGPGVRVPPNKALAGIGPTETGFESRVSEAQGRVILGRGLDSQPKLRPARGQAVVGERVPLRSLRTTAFVPCVLSIAFTASGSTMNFYRKRPAKNLWGAYGMEP